MPQLPKLILCTWLRQAESVVLYPVLQSRLGTEGAQWAARALAEHALIEQAVADVLALRSVGGEALSNRLKQLQVDFVAHQAEAEGAILPAVADVLSPEESLALAAQFKAAKQAAPIAPQPAVAQAQAAQATVVAGSPPVAAPAQAMGGAGPSTVTTGDTSMGGTTGGGAEIEEAPSTAAGSVAECITLLL
ncbi:hemerythrin [Chlorella sorokiniana]|uniref:Hemerythrin n=1 Tax=Chlorella sorokiniana TaxID=3076 RepID=A0A2P6TK31_CHLSO|nr:hemerythrin [Chlorella sorokiniana]|eukprot:PRW44452.1 hemerythrin [Chlorella sorokiniana]